ncbi:polyadenylate-binding protein-interacting protein 2-like [Dorcoceras hygrometricum]|uniref:Polyadenylate-binding protein-interacting protein 2-like n=1 Tax=Dorcoceras hygrometricum TaxID=472368 RepID=A0A2Z7BRV2_9LAMI|nr:polyadenylate-binding protein-interacting protein 2-like [Dorcoceras hygrometricum]
MATSALNPNAPIFVPSAYRQVEDFSDQWWDLVQSSPWFRDYWLRECFSDPELDPPSIHTLPQLLDYKSLVNDNDKDAASDDASLDLVSLGWLKWRKPRGTAPEAPRYFPKAARAVKVKVNPRPIQQPR